MALSKKVILLASGTLVLAAGPVRSQNFGEYYGFGDSLTDNGRIGRLVGPGAISNFNPRLYREDRWSNGPVFFEILPGRIGVPYRVQNDFAIGGAVSGANANPAVNPPFSFANLPQLQDQVSQFIQSGRRLAANDLSNIWIGYNDISRIPLAATAAQRTAALGTILDNTALAIRRLEGVGGRDFVVFNQQSFRAANGGAAQELNAALPGRLQQLALSSGSNIRLFDVDALVLRLRANPTAFGYNADANIPCAQVPTCLNGGFDAQNGYISPDGVHLTGRTNTYIAEFLANQLNAPSTVAPQATMAQSIGRGFSNALLDRLDVHRWTNGLGAEGRVPLASGNGMARFDGAGPLAVFAYGTYLNSSPDGARGASGYDADAGAGTIGAEVRATRNVLFGAAFNYTHAGADLRSRAGAKTEVDSYQVGAFASISYPSFFLDGALTYGWNDYDLSRRGVFDGLSGRTDGKTFTAAARGGYLFDLPAGGVPLRLGPIAGIAYSNVSVQGYAETGDPLLTIGVDRQNLGGLTGSLGGQVRTSFAAGTTRINPYLNVTAEHDFRDSDRSISTYQTYAPGLIVRTRAGRGTNETYGRVAGGASVDLSPAVALFALASTTFARGNGEEVAVSAGLRYRF